MWYISSFPTCCVDFFPLSVASPNLTHVIRPQSLHISGKASVPKHQPKTRNSPWTWHFCDHFHDHFRQSQWKTRNASRWPTGFLLLQTLFHLVHKFPEVFRTSAIWPTQRPFFRSKMFWSPGNPELLVRYISFYSHYIPNTSYVWLVICHAL